MHHRWSFALGLLVGGFAGAAAMAWRVATSNELRYEFQYHSPVRDDPAEENDFLAGGKSSTCPDGHSKNRHDAQGG